MYLAIVGYCRYHHRRYNKVFKGSMVPQVYIQCRPVGHFGLVQNFLQFSVILRLKDCWNKWQGHRKVTTKSQQGKGKAMAS